MVLYEIKFVSLHHKIDKQTILSLKRTILYPKGDNYVIKHKKKMNMKQVLFLLLMLTMPLFAQGKADEKKLLERIDYMIDNDKHYQDIKEKELKHLKQLAFDAEDDKTQLLFLDSIYHAYSAYRYDSAYAYMKRGLELAQRCNDTYYITLNQINRASILSVRGFYGKAEALLQTLNPD